MNDIDSKAGASQAGIPSCADIIRGRRAVRAYLPMEVPPATLQAVFELAQQSPSNCNTQPWVVHAVQGASLKDLGQVLSAAAGDPAQHQPDFAYDGQYDGAYKARQFDAAMQLYGAMEIAREDKAARYQAFLRNYAFFGAPHAAFVFLPEPFGLREAIDCGMYAQTLMLAMASHGIASCPQTALGLHAPLVRELLGIPSQHKLLFGISFGYEDDAASANRCRVARAPIEEVVRFHL
jgi:nitroreductase